MNYFSKICETYLSNIHIVLSSNKVNYENFD